MRRYGKPYVARVLYDQAISKLDYGIDLSHLKKIEVVGPITVLDGTKRGLTVKS